MKILWFVLATWLASGVAANDKDQILTLVETAVANNICITDISVAGDDNCITADGKRGACEGIASCVCNKPDKHIEWQGTQIKNFSVYFYDDNSPFKDSCSLESDNQGKLKCRIKADAGGSYDYGVKVAGCDDFDPRIIIKQN
jgi:hypothetical protein